MSIVNTICRHVNPTTSLSYSKLSSASAEVKLFQLAELRLILLEGAAVLSRDEGITRSVLPQVPSDKEKVKSRGTTANLGATAESSADSITSDVTTA